MNNPAHQYPDDIFSRARESVKISDVAGVKLWDAGARKRGSCPLCGGGEKSGSRPFTIDDKTGLFYCFTCLEGGDVVSLEHRLRSSGNETPLDAAKRLVGGVPYRLANAPVMKPPKDLPPDESAARFAHEAVKASVPAMGTLAESYLRSRGIEGHVLSRALRHVRFHPRLWHMSGKCYPAMIVQPATHEGMTGGIHATYLRNDGQGKAPIMGGPAKVMWGPQALNGLPGGAWLCNLYDQGPLVVAEGIETALSRAMMMNGPCRFVATLSLNRFMGGWRTDSRGCRSVLSPEADLSKRAFVWPENEAAPWGKVIGCADHDMKPITIKVRHAARPRDSAEVTIGATDRARVAGALMTAQWKRYGNLRPWTEVVAELPPVGADFNDMIKGNLT
jgi:hypothetical protein